MQRNWYLPSVFREASETFDDEQLDEQIRLGNLPIQAIGIPESQDPLDVANSLCCDASEDDIYTTQEQLQLGKACLEDNEFPVFDVLGTS